MPDGTEVLERWYACLEPEVQTEVEFYLKYLEVTEDWFTPGDAETLDGRHTSLTVIRFEIDRGYLRVGKKSIARKDKYRLVGFVAQYPHCDGLQDPGEFVILLGCQKWKGRTAPPDALDWALQLKADLEAGKGFKNDHSI